MMLLVCPPAPWLLGKEHPVGSAVVFDGEPALLDVDVRGTVLPHRAELDQMDIAIHLGDREHHVEGAEAVGQPR